MLKEAIGTGATVDLAKADAIAQLGISADSDFEIEVLEMPTKKMFGLLGTTPAKVKVSYDAPSEAGEMCIRDRFSIYERIIVSYTYAVNRLLQKIPDLSRCTKKQAKMRLLLNRLT